MRTFKLGSGSGVEIHEHSTEVVRPRIDSTAEVVLILPERTKLLYGVVLEPSAREGLEDSM